jgi:hypothetical protein
MQNFLRIIGNTHAQKYPDIHLRVTDVFIYADSVFLISVNEDAKRRLVNKKIE